MLLQLTTSNATTANAKPWDLSPKELEIIDLYFSVQVSQTIIVGHFDFGHIKDVSLPYTNYTDCIYPDIIHNSFISFFTELSSPVPYIFYHYFTIFALGVWMFCWFGMVFCCFGVFGGVFLGRGCVGQRSCWAFSSKRFCLLKGQLLSYYAF